MVRETRHLWVGNLPDNPREERIRELFKRYGRVQSVKLLPRIADQEKAGEITMACTVAFMDIKSASKAHNAELKIDDRTLNTEYYEPAAIPSATASPQATTSPYSTSPGANRFPNGHGTSEEHAAFQERFYAPAGGEADAPPPGGGGSRRGAAPASAAPPSAGRDRDKERERDRDKDRDRGRDRDRSYRSGGAAYDRHGRPAGGGTGGGAATAAGGGAAPTAGAATAAATATTTTWPYESPRYNSTVAGTQSETGYNSTSETNDRKSSEHGGRKKTKSRSGSRSPSPSGSVSSRSPSRSRSRSSSSSSSSSTSRATSSTGSPKSRRQNTSSQTNQEDRRPLAICVKNLPLRSSDTSLKDGLFHEYKKHGKVTWVKIVGQSADRHAIVCFKKPEDVEKALEVSQDKLFFGCKIEVAPYFVCDVEDSDLRPYEAEIDEYHPKATRTLFIGNLEKDVTASDLRKHFDQFGEIIEIDIKKQGAVSSYAFCQYSDIVSVVRAIRKMDGEHLGNNRIKLGFGKSMPYNCVWMDGINETVNEKYVRMQFEPFGAISRCIIDREKGQGLVFYEQVLHAQQAVVKMRGFVLKSSKLQVDFASRECQECFFERLEKQGTVLDRTVFEDRRDATARSFETAAAVRFSSRYDTPTRPRTASYSSRSGTAANQVPAAIPSPGTPGSMTPRGSGTRTRLPRFAYEYDPADYADRHFRSYDEYSQGSAASHEDPYEHEYVYGHDSPTRLDPIEVRVIQNIEMPFVQPDIRNLQKERVHLLEQLDECPSSGDELISSKKRLKLDLLDPAITGDVIIEANRDHRKVMEVRRLSDVNLRHHSRRPSIDSLKYKDLVHDRGYLPHSVGCKRRKTAGSDGGTRSHHYDHSGSESVGGSRPGTPLCDEKPETFQPSEPRRVPRDREGPLTLPLPKFASQVMRTGSVSVAGIKGQKETCNILASPPPAATSPRISNPKPPSPVHVPPPASPPPRPPSLSSNSSDSDATPPSPSLEERIKSLDEKYEKWSGSRALSAASGDVLATLDANLERFKLGHKLLNLNLKEVQPSEIVKSVMAKRSVFDEDLKRLENVGEKYEPKEYGLFPRATSMVALTAAVPQSPLPDSPMSAPAALKLAPAVQSPKTPTMLSPRSSGAGIPAAKGLQYPFPSHPPIQMAVPATQPPSVPTGTTAATTQASSSSTTVVNATPPTIAKSTTHCESRPKQCASVPSDSRTSSKINLNVNRTAKCDSKTISNIPSSSETDRKTKPGDKCESVSNRRDSNGGSSPRAAVGSRRNSDSTTRRIEEGEKYEAESLERSKSEEHKREPCADKARIENERLEKERAEKEMSDRLEKERLERENEERQRLEQERLEKEKAEKERREREKAEQERAEKLRLEKERAEKARLERERIERQEKEHQERLEREERERRDREGKELLEKQEKERKEQERKEKEEKERRERHEEADRRRDEERNKHRDENHEKKKDDHKHRDGYSEIRHRENNLHEKSTKDEKSASHDGHKKESHESRGHDRSRHHSERDSERRKESIKENRDNNIFDKQKNINDIKDPRTIVETRHMSIDLDKNKPFDNKHDPNKRKERNNSLPANISNKRRISSHESLDSSDEAKRIKLSHDHKKISERRDSKDSSRSEDRSKNGSKHKNNSVKSLDKYNSRDEEKRKEKEREERHKKHKLEKQKSKSKSREKEPHDPLTAPITNSVEFLAKLNLKSNEEIEKQAKEKESKEKRKESSHYSEEKKPSEDNKLKRDKVITMETKEIPKQHRDDASSKSSEEKKKRDRIRKALNTSDSDSDEPKKHSIFDIVDDEPAYISMYDKVKARSCKNMQKQEEEKRQEKIKAKFSQLKQSRARREEKKRSTSWDEDSDSDKEGSEMKFRRCPKLIIDSSDESQERKKKRDINTDSDCSLMRQPKCELAASSEDDFKNKHQTFKGCKSRITSDTSDDDYKSKIINSVPLFMHTEEHIGKNEKVTSVKNELERLIKKERRNSKYQENNEETTMHELISEAESIEPKLEKFNDHQMFENTTDDEAAEMKKERSERREKKHKKKQKKKHLLGGEETTKVEADNVQDDPEKNKHNEKKKEHAKKEKKKDKNKDGRDKSKRAKKNRTDSKCEKREGKIETIFGSLSEDSEAGTGEILPSTETPSINDENAQQATAYNSESDKDTETMIAQAREEHKKRKEKKRREKERRLLAAEADEDAASNSNDNSMDFADMGKQLEANIKEDNDGVEVKTEANVACNDAGESFNLAQQEHMKKEREERKDSREKKKKRKKNKEEKSKHHHHHHHHDKSKAKSPELRKEIKVDVKIEVEESACHTPVSQSLPSIFEPSESKSSPDIIISPSTRETVAAISPIPKTPTSNKEKKREPKLIPGFGSEIDEKLHESAIKSISEFEPVVKKEEIKEEPKEEKPPEPTEEKARVVISQEETEDAVAALLGESFGREQFDERYTEDINAPTDQAPNLTEESNVQDDEEMRQAVQSLSTADLDVKPETPQSENDLQIDTDTEEQDDVNVPFQKVQNSTESKREDGKIIVATPIYNKTSIGSPPSLTPIVKPVQNAVMESAKQEEVAKSLPILPEQKQIIPQKWPVQKTPEPVKNAVSEVVTTPVIVTSVVIQGAPVVTTTTTTKAFAPISAPTVIKVDSKFPPLAEIPKQTVVEQKVTVSAATSGNTVHLHNLPARSPIPPKQALAIQDANLIPIKANLNVNRLPITSVMAAKPLQAAAMILPQAKVAHPLETPKLVSPSEIRPKMVIQTTGIQPPQYTQLVQGQPRMMIRHVIPTRAIPPYGAYVGNVHPATYNFPVKDNPHMEKLQLPAKPAIIVPALSVQRPASPKMPATNPNVYQATLITSKPTSAPLTVAVISSNSPKHVVSAHSPKIFAAQSPKSTPPQSPQQKANLPAENPTVINCTTTVAKLEVETLQKPAVNVTKLYDDIKIESKPPSPVNVIVKEPTDVKKEEPVKAEKSAIEKVTDELNLTLEKQADVKEEAKLEENMPEVVKVQQTEPPPTTKEEEHALVEEIKKEANDNDKTEPDSAALDEEKADTESIVSDISKERSTSADLLAKEDPLGPQEDSDYWSAKEVNIDSVIKTLCSADELSDHSSENGKDDWGDEERDRESPDKKSPVDTKDESPAMDDEGVEHEEQKAETPTTTRGMTRGRGRGGRGRGRGRGGAASVERVGVTTRRSKINREQPAPPTASTKRGRGGRPRSERKSSKESDTAQNDVYEFRDDSDDNNKEQRPRLVLTIKSSVASNTSNSHTTAIVKEITKDGAKEIGQQTVVVSKDVPAAPVKASAENKEEFASPQTNTRKSKRLQEKDISKTTVDDTIEDVVKNTIQTRASANQRRSARQVTTKPTVASQQDTPRKSPRGRKPRNSSEPAENSSSEETTKEEITPKPVEKEATAAAPPVLVKDVVEKPKEPEKTQPKPALPPKDKPFEGLKAAMLRRIKGELTTASRNHEPTNLIDPVTGLLTPMRECEEGRYIPLPGSTTNETKKAAAAAPATAIPKAEPVIKSFAEVLMEQQTVITQQSTVVPKPHSLKAHVLSQVKTAVVPPVSAPVSLVTPQQTPVLQQRPAVPKVAVNQPINVNAAATHLAAKVKPPVLSPQSTRLPNHQQKQFVKQVPVPGVHPNVPAPYGKLPSNLVNIIHVAKGAMKQKHQQIFPGQVVASPPPTKAMAAGAAGRVVQVPASAVTKGVMEPPKVDVSLPSVAMNRPALSPQARVGAPHPVTTYEPSLHGESRSFVNSRSPPPAHQNSPSPKGDTMPHFPPGPLRPPPDLPAHYIPHIMQYQQFLRQHLQQRSGMEKAGEEAEEAPVTSPPLELRRPGSVGLGVVPGQGAAVVPHSLHSPHDRATESPQIAQVYNSLPPTARIPPYHPNRYFEQTEPPPAHRPLTSHASLTAMGAHMGSMAVADRPGTILPPDRPMGAHLPSAHMGPSRRGPLQAETLFMLLKQYPLMWQGLLALKNDQAAVQMYFVSGNNDVAKLSLPKNTDGTTPPLRIFQRMRLEPPQVEGVARKMQMENEHCMLLALPCGYDHVDVLKQSTNLKHGFITYLQQKQAAGIVNVAAPGTTQPPAYVVHIFPSCDFVNENLRRIAPSLLERVADIPNLLIVITTV